MDPISQKRFDRFSTRAEAVYISISILKGTILKGFQRGMGIGFGLNKGGIERKTQLAVGRTHGGIVLDSRRKNLNLFAGVSGGAPTCWGDGWW